MGITKRVDNFTGHVIMRLTEKLVTFRNEKMNANQLQKIQKYTQQKM